MRLAKAFRSKEGVSPVIATILMVAITVVLAAVLYVMVTGLLQGPGTVAGGIGVSVGSSTDGTAWIMLISSVQGQRTYDQVSLRLIDGDGTTNLTATALSVLDWTRDGCRLEKSGTGLVLSPGDMVLCRSLWYGGETGYQFLGGGAILARGTFQ